MDNNFDDVLDKLSAQVKAEQVRADFERQRLAAELRRLQIEQRRGAMEQEIWEMVPGINEALSTISTKLDRLVDVVVSLRQNINAISDIQSEWFEELSEHVSRIERGVLVLIGSRRGDYDSLEYGPHITSLKRQLAAYRKTLDTLQEKKAKYGLDTPVSVEHEISEASEAVNALEAILREYEI